MSWGSDEVQTAVNSAVGHLASVHPGLWVQVVLKLAVYVVNDRLPAARNKRYGFSSEDHSTPGAKASAGFTSCCCQQHRQTLECQQLWAAAGHFPPLPRLSTAPPEPGTKWQKAHVQHQLQRCIYKHIRQGNKNIWLCLSKNKEITLELKYRRQSIISTITSSIISTLSLLGILTTAPKWSQASTLEFIWLLMKVVESLLQLFATGAYLNSLFDPMRRSGVFWRVQVC